MGISSHSRVFIHFVISSCFPGRSFFYLSPRPSREISFNLTYSKVLYDKNNDESKVVPHVYVKKLEEKVKRDGAHGPIIMYMSYNNGPIIMYIIYAVPPRAILS